MRKILGLLLLAVLTVGLLPFVVSAYGPGAVYQIKVTGPSRAVTCENSVPLTAKVVSTESGKPVNKQNVRWSIDDGSSKDRLSATQTKTGKDGRTSVDLYIGLALGNRKVTATASGSKGRVTIQVKCVLPTPTPRPTAAPTPRPTKAPKPTPTATPASPTLERDTLTVGFRDPDLAGRAPLLLAAERGLFADAGLTQVDLVEAPDGLTGLLDGSLDLAIVPLSVAAQAIADGQPIVMLAGYRNYWPNVIAVRSDVTDAAGLAGQSIILGDDEARVEAATAALAAAGWELDGAGAQVVTPDGGIDAWVQAFLNGEVALTPILNRHRLDVSRAAATLVVDQQEYGEDVLLARRDLVMDAPLTIGAFLDGLLGGLSLIQDPANDADLLAAAESVGIHVSDDVIGGWPSDVEDLRPWDGGFGSADEAAGLGELQTYLLDRLGWLPPLAEAIAWKELNAAQAAQGLAANPVIIPLEGAPAASVRVGMRDDTLGGSAPFLLALSLREVWAAGIDALELVTGADGVAGVLDGSLDVAVVSQDEAAAAIDAGQAITIVAGYQDAANEDGATVLVTSSDRAATDSATTAAILQAYLRGSAALNQLDAFDTAVTASGVAAGDDVAAGWAAEVERFAPFDGSLSDGAPGGGTDLSALRAAQASLGLPVDQAG